ncbi:TetR/AcrR family transcriptional regulator [Motilimonas cestriensis]|uniref:TetR/AcrR family transcriptional regulator n=1 Tax=Motilimonas cestriensis TaxID=2742685 RepID=A0ABS8W3G7_9GAMM|nr:TetR/AcrR family transcriptional regulator [Motilimonas cestriensis]MCE2593497.1 TetR/AcrR family transcriptional regulator [Motilimonas cestriensis]
MATQAERNAATREKLKQSALNQLVNFGYAGTNASAICAAAGVTRGALNHQYPEGKYGLLADMVKTLFADKVNLYYGQGECKPLDLVLAMIDSFYQDPENEMQLVMMDLWLSMRGDQKLAELVGPEFYAGSAKLWSCFDHEDKDAFDTLANLVRTFITGLSVNRLDPSMTPAMARAQIKLMRQLVESEISQTNYNVQMDVAEEAIIA